MIDLALGGSVEGQAGSDALARHPRQKRLEQLHSHPWWLMRYCQLAIRSPEELAAIRLDRDRYSIVHLQIAHIYEKQKA